MQLACSELAPEKASNSGTFFPYSAVVNLMLEVRLAQELTFHAFRRQGNAIVRTRQDSGAKKEEEKISYD